MRDNVLGYTIKYVKYVPTLFTGVQEGTTTVTVPDPATVIAVVAVGVVCLVTLTIICYVCIRKRTRSM